MMPRSLGASTKTGFANGPDLERQQVRYWWLLRFGDWGLETVFDLFGLRAEHRKRTHNRRASHHCIQRIFTCTGREMAHPSWFPGVLLVLIDRFRLARLGSLSSNNFARLDNRLRSLRNFDPHMWTLFSSAIPASSGKASFMTYK